MARTKATNEQVSARGVSSLSYGEEGFIGPEDVLFFEGEGGFINKDATVFPSPMGKYDIRVYVSDFGSYGIDATQGQEHSFPFQPGGLTLSNLRKMIPLSFVTM